MRIILWFMVQVWNLCPLIKNKKEKLKINKIKMQIYCLSKWLRNSIKLSRNNQIRINLSKYLCKNVIRKLKMMKCIFHKDNNKWIKKLEIRTHLSIHKEKHSPKMTINSIKFLKTWKTISKDQLAAQELLKTYILIKER